MGGNWNTWVDQVHTEWAEWVSNHLSMGIKYNDAAS